MTREEQAQLIEKLVTELAESRTCENCKYYIDEVPTECRNGVSQYPSEDYNLVDEDFGCNNWEARTVSTDT